MKKTKFILLLISLVILIMTAVACQSTKKQISVSKTYFLKYQGIYNGYKNDSSTLNLIFLADDKSDLVVKSIANISLVGAKSLNVENWKLNIGDKYKNCKVYNLTLTVKNNENGKGSFGKVCINFTDGPVNYDIGDWHYNVIDKTRNDLDIISNSGPQPNFKNYFFEVKNISTKNIELKKNNLKNIDQINNIIAFVQNIQSYQNVISVNPNKTLKLTYNFKPNSSYDLYYFSPLVNYQINDKTFYYIPLATFYGFPFNQDKMEILYEKYLNQP